MINERKKLIENIKSEYLQEKNKTYSSIESMWGQYQKMAKELSEGIYAEDNHFIYELIQNAEDTSSNEDVHVIEFTLEDDGLIVFNNELGFNEDQIKAICAFGKSTKSADKNKGYIGEKGIGFKSVFKITDRPAIHSNEYCFYFRRLDENGETEYIIPHWIDEDELKLYPKKFQKNTHTTLFLPFDKSKKVEKLSRLREDIKQIEPILLLFLNRLNSIKIYDKEEELVSTTKSSKKNENIKVVSIKNKQSKDKYYVFKKEIKVDPTLDEVRDTQNGRRQKVTHREIILAFPDNKNDTKEDRIFAFLPTNLRSRLGFIIQADFILQSGRENIAIDSEWNQWQLDEIRDYISTEVIFDFQQHSKLKFAYLKYFLRNGDSDNELINTMYNELLERLKTQKIILGQDEQWYKPKNILVLEKSLSLDSKYLKVLYGENFEQIHPKFELPDSLADTFDVIRISRQELVAKIAHYFGTTPINTLNEDIVYELTVFLSKHSIVNSRSAKYDQTLFFEIKRVLPIIPKYKRSSKFYYANSMYLSDEYKPDFYLEDIVDIDKCTFETFNFLSPIYFNNDQKRVEDFLRRLLEEQKDDNNKKTIEFFSIYPEYLQDYLRKNKIKHYDEVFQFLIDNQKDNIERIKAIPLILTRNKMFFSAKDEERVFFPAANVEESLQILDEKLYKLTVDKKKYKALLQDLFLVKEADIHNIILEQFLPWFKENRTKRNDENDKVIVDYTEPIIKHFEEFDSDDKKRIKEALCFIGTNSKEKYLKSGYIYLPQLISEEYFYEDSIEKYVSDASFFNFLGTEYLPILGSLDQNTVKMFFNVFNFKTNTLVEGNLNEFITYYTDDLTLDESISAFRIIVENEEFKGRNNTFEKLKNIDLFSQVEEKLPVQSLFFEQIDGLDLPYLHPEYQNKINFTQNRIIRKYFQNPYKLAPFIQKLKNCTDLNVAKTIYRYLSKKSEFDVNRHGNPPIPPIKIKKAFNDNALIVSENGEKYYSKQVVWTSQKSGTELLALSNIYPESLKSFFVEIVQISQHRSIKQIVETIKDIKTREKTKTKTYFDLLADLSQLVVSQEEIENYRRERGDYIDSKKLSNNIWENAKLFLALEEKIFISDANTYVGADKIILNDIGLVIDDEEVKNSILTLKYYGRDAVEGLIRELNLKTLSHLPKQFTIKEEGWLYSIRDYRLLLNFAYDLLFTKYYDVYVKLTDREEELQKINSIEIIRVVSKIDSQLMINNIAMTLKNEKFFFNRKQNELILTDERYIGKAIASVLQYVSDKDIAHFMEQVIERKIDRQIYYLEEEIKEKQKFSLDISSVEKEINDISTLSPSDNPEDIEIDTGTVFEPSSQKPLTPEEEQKQRILTGTDIVGGYDTDVQNPTGDIEPVAEGIKQVDIDDFFKKQKKRTKNVRKTIKKRKKRSDIKPVHEQDDEKIYRQGDESTKDFFRSREQYRGHCQICGFTFPTKNNVNYCERFTWADKKRNKILADIIYPGNSLCLCANCHSIIKNGGSFKATFLQNSMNLDSFEEFLKEYNGELIEEAPEIFQDHLDFSDMYALPIEINKDETNIYFTEQHLVEFFAFLNR